MGYKLIETRLASQDLDNILEYMAVRLQNPAAARKRISEGCDPQLCPDLQSR